MFSAWFVFGLIPNYYSSSTIKLSIASEVPGMMWLRAPYIGMNRHYLLHSGTKEISISTNIIQNSNLTVENKTIHLTSDTDISVNVITAGNYYIDVEGFMVLPRRESAKQFIIATGVPFSSSYPSEILIASYENTTSVSITFPRDLTGISIPNYTISVNLAAYKTYMLKSMYDLSGTYINSSHPISVIAGVRYSSTIYGYQSYLLEQVPPTNVLGTEYLVPPLQNHTTYILRTLSPSNHVLLKFYNSTGVYSFMVYRDLPLIMVNKNEPVFISSSQPIMVVQFGRAFMMTVPGISNYLRNYDFLVPTVKVPIVNYVCLISTNGNVLLDSKQPSGQSISFMNTTHGNFTIITTNITVGRHSITSTSGTTYFGAMLYGQYGGYGYGFPLGMGTTSDCSASPSASPLPTTGQTKWPSFSLTSPATTPATAVTATHGVMPGFNGSGLYCFSCPEVSHLYLCNKVERCKLTEVNIGFVCTDI